MLTPPKPDADAKVRQEKTTCRCCSVQCGMLVTIGEDETVLKAEGDRHHPATRGYSCGKGRSIPERHHSSQRLLKPRIDGRATDWDECLADLGGRLNRIIDAHGSTAIGRYFGTGGAYDTLGMSTLGRLTAALKTPQCYGAATVDVAPLYRAAQMVTGFHAMLPSWSPELEGPSLAIVLGANFCVSHNYMGSDMANPVQKLRDYREGGGEVWTIDPKRTKTAINSDHHLALRPNSDVYLLAWLVRELLAEGADREELESTCSPQDIADLRAAVERFTLDRAIAQTGLEQRELLDLLDAFRRHRQVAILVGTGIAFSPHGLVCEWLRWVLLIITGSLDREDRKGMFFNVTSLAKIELGSWSNPSAVDRSDPAPQSRPDLPGFFGDYACAALADEIEAGNLKALIVFGGNPLISIPQPERVARALASLDVLAVIDPFETDLTQMATHVLPSSWQLERSDIRQRPELIQFAPALVAPLGDSKPGWWIVGAIAEKLGIDIFGDDTPLSERDEASLYRQMLGRARVSFDELAEAGVYGIETPRMDGWFRKSVLRERGWRLSPPSMIERLRTLQNEADEEAMLVAGRVDFATNSMFFPDAIRRETMPPAIHVSPDLCAMNRLADGDLVRISTKAGHLDGTVKSDGDLQRGTVWMNHGWLGRNVNHLFDTQDVDTLTTQPFFSSVPVSLEKIG
ncbi:MAG: molybdopterin-dependent oxidoreductase [Novosphingobium sp.]|nr:molybdopterin-dependent oxidoreductase [Novosphingobium sp.]